jgi:lambda family phage tail tape measure protein
MASQNIARLGVVLGLDTAEFTAQVDKAISENRKLKDSIKRDSQAALKESASLKLAAEDYGKTLTKVQMIEREINSGRFMNATKEMKQQLLDRAKAYDAIASSATKATAAEFKMNAQQKMGLTYQTTDLVTSLAAGQNPFIVLLQQGGQLKDQMGGLGNMFKAIGTILTPMRLVVGGVAAAFGTLAYAAYAGRQEFDKLKDTITLTGNFAGVTTEKFYTLATELSGRTNASIGMTKDALNAVLASGKFTAASISSVTQAVISYAQIAGVDAKTASDKLISGLDGTASGARGLNREMNFLTLEQYKQIEALEKAGKLQEAAKVASIALNTQLAAQRRELGYLDKAWETTTNALSTFWNLLKEIGKPETTDQVIAQLDRQIKAVQEAVGKSTGDSPFEKEQRKQLQLLKDQREAILETERLKARSVAARDVGDSKQKIEDRAAAGGIDKEKQIIAATEKAKASVRYTQALATANEVEKIELEAAKQVAEKRAEFSAKSEVEKRAMGGLLARQLAAEELDIEAKKNEKIRQIRQKEKIDIAKAQVEEQQKLEDINNAYAQMQATARFDAIEKTRNLELDKEDLQIKNQMIYATEKELQLAELQIKYQRLREAGGANLEQLKQQEAIEKFNIELRDTMKKTQEVFDSVWGNMGSAIDRFVKTGKLSMKDLARSIIQDLIAIQMKAAALSFLRMMFAPTMGPSIDGGGALPSSFNQYLAPRAAGGPVSGNTPYMVGEKGPELFMPSGSGTIIPNNQTSQMGGTTNVTNNYINAIDTKSFEDRLLGSSNAIWAANQYAGKSLAVNRGRA